MTRLLIALSFLFIAVSTALAQHTLTGKVVDQQTGSPLAFVSLVFNDDPHLGTTTDIDGYFSFEHQEVLTSLRLSYVGYRSKTLSLSSYQEPLLLKLEKTDLALNEVVVVAGENPAYRIIRAAQRQRMHHHPERIAQYRCDSYQKMRLFDKLNAPQASQAATILDTLHQDSTLDFFYSLIEIVSEIKQKAPDLYEEHIIASKMTGLDQPNFLTAISEIQPTNFHRENFLILDREYLNPISGGSITWYEFRLEDTLYQGVDTVYRISFFPRKNKNFDALKGVLLINTNGYAIQTVRAEPAINPKITLRIEQQYAFVNEQHWFPQQLNFELSLSPNQRDTFTIQGRRYLRNIDFNPELKPKDFNFNTVTMAVDAHERDSSFWVEQRVAALSRKERKTYQVYDDLLKNSPSGWLVNTLVNSVNELEEERIQLGDLAVNYTQLLEFNAYENFRLGLGLYNSYRWSPYLTVGGYFAYGFGDKSWKYGSSLTLRPNPLKDAGLQISYVNDVLEPAAIIQNTHSLSKKVLPVQSFIRRNILRQMDRVEEVELSGYTRFARHFKGRIFGNWSYRQPLYNYSYQRGKERLETFRIVRAGVQLRFSYRERLVQMGTGSLSFTNRYPTLYLSYTKGFNGFLDGQVAFYKLIVGLESSFFVKGVGRLSGLAQAGLVQGETPYPILFNGRGSYQKNRFFLVRNTFQTMGPNEFANNQFAYAFLEHNFGNLLLQFGDFKPQLKLYQAVGFGWLDNQQAHEGLALQDMRQGYYESGVMLSDIIRLPMLNIGYFGLGAGLFVRYGPYAHSKRFLDNVVYKIDMTTSF
jgi:hypothetical protein